MALLVQVVTVGVVSLRPDALVFVITERRFCFYNGDEVVFITEMRFCFYNGDEVLFL